MRDRLLLLAALVAPGAAACSSGTPAGGTSGATLTGTAGSSGGASGGATGGSTGSTGSTGSAAGSTGRASAGSSGGAGNTGTGGGSSSGGSSTGPFDAGMPAYFVSPGGADTNPGTEAAPWQHLAYAQSQVQSKPRPLAVVLRGGTYFLSQALSFTSTDSGADGGEVIWEAYPGERPIVSGATPVTGWFNDGGNLWQAQLPASTLPFESLYYEPQGAADFTRRLRPRLGQGTSNDAGTYLGDFLRVADAVYAASPMAACPALLTADAGYKCFDHFYFEPDAGLTSALANLNPPAGNPCGAPAHGTAPAGDVEIDLFEAWTMEQMRVSCVDDANHLVYFTAPTPLSADAADPGQQNYHGPTQGHRYVVENVQDALSQPGQWFVDRSRTPWVLSYLANAGEDPASDAVRIPQVAPPLLAATGLAWVTFQGITFEMDDYVPGASGFNQDDNGENALPAAVDCESCQNVTFEGITARHTSASGIQVATAPGSPAATGVAVQDSIFYDVGDCGVHLGRKASGSDTDATLPQNLTVQNDLIQGYGRVFADGEGIGTGAMQNVTLAHNDITDGYHAGISVCNDGCPSAKSSHGTANVQSLFNHIWNVIKGITSDGGTLYYNIGANVKTALGGLIQHNLIHDVTDSSIVDHGVKGSGYGGEGIYLDAQTGGVTVSDNVVYRVSAYTMWQSEGPAPGQPGNVIENNVFAYGRQGMFQEQDPWPQGCCGGAADGGWACPASPPTRVSFASNVFYFDLPSSQGTQGFLPLTGCAYACDLPVNQFQSFVGDLYWRTDGTFATDAKSLHVDHGSYQDASTCNGADYKNWDYVDFAQWQDDPTLGGKQVAIQEDDGGVVADPGFANPGWPADDYTLAAAPVPGFDPSATNQTLTGAGRQSEAVTVPPVPDTFPTYRYPASAF
ncbi:MAG TPA: right-handed parallel beta-helix repeat-containing protein [Myxococcales bacterium]|nr:right-handed parallel beta-helix repeat-containing protein [Myxococcales bacterium]